MRSSTRTHRSLQIPAKPRFRGRIHQVAFILAIPAGLLLVAMGTTLTERVTATVFACTLAAMLGVSASYHRYPWAEPALRRMRRLDHSMIFLLIAGTYTPFTVLALDGFAEVALLVAVWTGAALGIGLKLLRIDGLHAVGGTLYITLGWVSIAAMPQFFRALPAASTVLMCVGGAFYTGGALVLARKRPDPDPTVFGYHEVWHACVVAGALSHYLGIVFLLTR